MHADVMQVTSLQVLGDGAFELRTHYSQLLYNRIPKQYYEEDMQR